MMDYRLIMINIIISNLNCLYILSDRIASLTIMIIIGRIISSSIWSRVTDISIIVIIVG